MKKVWIVSLAVSAALQAGNLAQEALNAGLAPIPSDATKIKKLIDPKGVVTPERVELGKKLYFDPRLSKSGLISCNTCHNLATGGVDGVAAAIGHKWKANPHHLNSPTVYNAVFAKRQFWDGRSPDLEDQAKGPIQAAPEMAAFPDNVVKKVTSMPAYVAEFKKAYGEHVKIDFDTITQAIATFERTLVTPSRFDAFLEGDDKALNADEKEGLKLFLAKGCVSCHSGIALGGGMQKFPLVKPYKYADIGDFKGDKNGMVKVPTLRNITETAPYFHNGAIWSLKEAVQEMGRTQLGIELSDDEAGKIVAFLGSLTGKKPEVVYPQLPARTDATPKPDVN